MILHRKLRGVAALLVLALAAPVPGIAAENRAPRILLDPGHSPAKPGARGVRGIPEVAYNDRFAARLATVLKAASFSVELTRQADEALGLAERAALANARRPDLFLSIHHDSAQLVYLRQVPGESGDGYQTTRPIAGYSLFVSHSNPQYAASLRLAERLGGALHALGRSPTMHHAEDISGERRELLDAHLGIYRFDDLAVLARTQVPAVLLEVGVIVDADDERYVTTGANQEALCQAILRALQGYFTDPAARSAP